MKTKEAELHGGNIYKIFREKGIKELLDYSSNINPYGLPERLKKAIAGNLDMLEKYPDPDYYRLRKKIAEENGVEIENIILGNGATEVIFLLMKVLKPEKVLIVSPTFSEYERALEAGRESVEVQLKIDYFKLLEKDGFRIGVENLIKKLDKGYDMLIMCNPNNPTGQFVHLEEMEKIYEKCLMEGIRLFIDEAFIDFVSVGLKESIINTRRDRKGLFVTRAFTKFFAIPGLRLGYGICFDEDAIFRINAVKEPWSVNSIAELAGITLMDDAEYIEMTRKWIEEEKGYMYEALKKIKGVKPYKTEVNFILVKIDEEYVNKGLNVRKLREMLLEKGILIRDASNFVYLDESYFRLAVKDRENNIKVVTALEECLG